MPPEHHKEAPGALPSEDGHDLHSLHAGLQGEGAEEPYWIYGRQT